MALLSHSFNAFNIEESESNFLCVCLKIQLCETAITQQHTHLVELIILGSKARHS